MAITKKFLNVTITTVFRIKYGMSDLTVYICVCLLVDTFKDFNEQCLFSITFT